MGFYGLKPDYTRCRSTSIRGGSWSCPITSLKFAPAAEPDLEKCRAAAVEAEFPPASAGRISGRNVTLGTSFGEPLREIDPPSGWTAGHAYAFNADPAASAAGVSPAAPHAKSDAAKGL